MFTGSDTVAELERTQQIPIALHTKSRIVISIIEASETVGTAGAEAAVAGFYGQPSRDRIRHKVSRLLSSLLQPFMGKTLEAELGTKCHDKLSSPLQAFTFETELGT